MSEGARLVAARRPQAGSALIEVMVALLIFAVGALGLIAAQGTTLKNAGQTRYRGVAAAMAADLIDHMWLSERTATELQAKFASGGNGEGYNEWLARLVATGLPGVVANPPQVSFTTVAGGGSSTSSTLATVVVHWQAPGETSVHSYTALAQLKE